jgi:hypothetical protein
MTRPRTWTVYYSIDTEGTICDISYGNKEPCGFHFRKYMSNLSESEAQTLVDIMKSYYKLETFDYLYHIDHLPDKLKFLKFPPKTHKSRLTSSWNKGHRKSGKTYKTSSTKANKRLESKKSIWLSNTFVNKACQYCYEAEVNCLRYLPDHTNISKLNKILSLSESRDHLLNIIESQRVVCLNCQRKIDMGLELIKNK